LILPLLLTLQVIGQEFNPKAEILGSTEKIVKGAPFSADAVSESVQIMFDGNKIIRRVNSRLFRDSEGRFRRDELPTPVGIGSFVEMPKSVSIFDPVAGLNFYLNSSSKTVRQVEFKSKKNQVEIEKRQEQNIKRQEQNVKRQEQNVKRDEQKAKEQEQKRNSDGNGDGNGNGNGDDEQKPKPPKSKKPADSKQADNNIKIPFNPKSPVKPNSSNEPSMAVLPKGEVKTESLGTRSIEGVEAEGTRFTKTIPAGEIGNERAFEIVYERWFSKNLQMIVSSKYTDPRFGEQTYQLTNIKQTEPDGGLFKVPADYKIDDNSWKLKPKKLFEKKKSE